MHVAYIVVWFAVVIQYHRWIRSNLLLSADPSVYRAIDGPKIDVPPMKGYFTKFWKQLEA